MKSETDIKLTIDALGARGDGIATFGVERVYVPYAAPGDRLTARLARDRKDHLIGRIRAVIAPGPARVVAPCPHFGTAPNAGCGGCALQHLNEEACRAWKLERLAAALAREGVAAEVIEPLAVSPPGSRRRADLTVSPRKDGVILGFNARASHRVVDLATCAVLRPSLVALLAPLRDLLAALMAPGERGELRLCALDSGVDVLLVATIAIGAGARQRIAAFAEQHDVTRVAVGHPRRPGHEIVVERRPARIVIAGVPAPFPSGAFQQATAEGEAALQAFVATAVVDAKRVLDLYSGLGTFTFPLAKAGARVHAVDVGKAEIAALGEAARGAMLHGVTAEQRDLERRPFAADALADVDAVVFDPPRAGAAAQAERLAASKVPRVVAVSCNPASFARDARLLIDGGYRLTRLRPVDQFRWSPHLELAAAFARES
jgi:23S rRNA (uracil1939-C5)-methyltransferase